MKLLVKITKYIFALIGILGVSCAFITYIYLTDVYKSDGFGGISYLTERGYNEVKSKISSMEKKLLNPITYRAGEGNFQNFISLPKGISKNYNIRMLDRPKGILHSFTVNPASIENKTSPYSLQTYTLSTAEQILIHEIVSFPKNLESDFEKCAYLCEMLYENNQKNLMPTVNQDVFELMSRVIGGDEVACHEISIMFQYISASMGIYTRSVCASNNFGSNSSLTKGGAHCMVEAYCREIDKWILFDPFYNRWFTDKSKTPLSMLDVRDKLYNDEQAFLKGESRLNKDDFYYKYAVFVFDNRGVLYIDSKITDNPQITVTNNRREIYPSLRNSKTMRPIIKKLFSSTKYDFFTLRKNLLPIGTSKISNNDIVRIGKNKNLYPLLRQCSLSNTGTITRSEEQGKFRFISKMSGSASFFIKLKIGVYYVLKVQSINEDTKSANRFNIISSKNKVSVVRTNIESANTSVLIKGNGKTKIEFVGSPTNAPSTFSISSIELIQVS